MICECPLGSNEMAQAIGYGDCGMTASVFCPACERHWCSGCFASRRHHSCQPKKGLDEELAQLLREREQELVPA